MKKEEIKTASEREGLMDVKQKKTRRERKGDRDGRLERRRWGGEGRSSKLPLHNRGDE